MESCHREILDRVQAVSIAVPTPLHYSVAKDFLLRGIDVLLEKPITVTVEEADELIEVSDAKGRIFQVGHLERFNPAVLALEARVRLPLFFEIHRMNLFTPRALDVDVVLDPVSADSQRRSFGVLKKGGILVALTEEPRQDLARESGVRATMIGVKPDGRRLADIGKIIGKKGRTAFALRTLVAAVGKKAGKKVTLEVLD